VKTNHRLEDSHQEVILMSDKTIQQLLDDVRAEIPILFKIGEGIAMLDMLAAFATLAMSHEYARPELTGNIVIKSGRHPVREKAHSERNIGKNSLAIIDELGRGTSTRDGLAIALSIAETLVDSGALVWFVTHFRDLAQILSKRIGVVNLHLAVDMSESNSMTMLYKIEQGFVEEDHYGLALARVVGLPQEILDTAERVSTQLEIQAMAKKKSSKALAIANRRKLILDLREMLIHARDGDLQGPALLSWLRRLQEEFVERMDDIEKELASSDGDDESIEESVMNARGEMLTGSSVVESAMEFEDSEVH